jgi:hypothetical protein
VKSTVLGILLATIAVYAWGFLYWGASSVPYSAWHETADDAAAGRALLEHFPQSGVYYLPANGNAPEIRSELYASGPTGFVILDVDGRPEFDPSIMLSGFALNAIVMTLLALLLNRLRPATATYAERLRVVLMIAAIAVVMVNFGDAVWWALPWNWEFAQAFYNFTALVLGGGILAAFAGGSGAESSQGVG